MAENLRVAFEKFRGIAQKPRGQGEKDMKTDDGRIYTINEITGQTPSFSCLLDFGRKLVKESPGKFVGPQVVCLSVDIKADKEGNMIGLNPQDMSVYHEEYGAITRIFLDGKEYEARYKIDEKRPEVVTFDSIYDVSDLAPKPIEDYSGLIKSLELPGKIDMFATTMKAIDIEAKVEDLRTNLYVLPKPLGQ